MKAKSLGNQGGDPTNSAATQGATAHVARGEGQRRPT